LDEAEGLVTAEIDLNEVESVRSRITVWQDRKPEFYT
jgi:predicted amidohydrolase